MAVNQTGVVKTNPKRGSVASCSSAGIVPVTFKELWSNFAGEKTPPYNVNGKAPKGFENQCAIRMSVTLHRVGVKMTSFSSSVVKPEGKASTIGRILLNNMATSTRANEMAQWLNTRPICGVGARQDVTGSNWESKVKGKTGIIFFGEYWSRDDESSAGASGGHIDLWNKDTLTPGWASTLRFTFRISRLPFAYSDLGKSKRIYFFEVK